MVSALRALVVCLFVASLPGAEPSGDIQRAIEEFKTQTASLGLRADTPLVAVHVQSPLSEWHGRLYENFRNDALDAVPHEIRQNGGDKGLLRRNQFGFNVAGPAVVPHILESRNTYFSLSYEGVREGIARTSLQTIPTMAQRTGDYSDVVDAAGNVIPIYDPTTTQPNAAYDPSQAVSTTNLQYTRSPFPGNVIPTTRLDPVALNALKYYPAPNTDVGPFFRNNYFVNSPETNTANGMIGKVDQSLRDRHRVTVEMAFSNGTQGAATLFPTPANPGPSNRAFETRRGSLEYVFTKSSRTVNTLTFEANSNVSSSGATQDQTNYASLIGLSGIAGAGFPVMQLG